MKQLRRRQIAEPIDQLPAIAEVVDFPQPTGDEDFVQAVMRIIACGLQRARENIEALNAVEAQIRREWGGERPYIGKTGEIGRMERLRRDERIRAEYRRGDHAPLLARRHRISERRIYKIVSGQN